MTSESRPRDVRCEKTRVLNAPLLIDSRFSGRIGVAGVSAIGGTFPPEPTYPCEPHHLRRTLMAIRNSEATWKGTLREGSGAMKLGSGTFEGPYTFASRFEEAKGTNPEELIGAAHAGCYSMFLSALLSNKGFTPARIHTTATVHLTAGPTISKIELVCEAEAPGVEDAIFQELAAQAKANCPVSKALAAVPEITLTATLKR
jgi:osmotically inducible protein OsmC